MNTVIFCAGHYGIMLMHMLRRGILSDEHSENIYFCDNYRYEERYIDGCKVLSPEELCQIKEDIQILISSPKHYDEVLIQLHDIGIRQPVYIVPEYVYRFKWNNINLPPFVKVDINKPRLRLIQIPITESCNMNCKGCNLIYNEKSNNLMDFEEFCVCMNDLGRLFSGVSHLTLLGGEPLLHPQLEDIVYEARRSFPDTELEIRTNGTLLFNLSENVFKAIADTDTEIWVSLYPPMIDKKDEITKELNKRCIRVRFIGPFYNFRKLVNARGDYDPDVIYQKCDKCLNLFEGSISCGLGYLIEKLEKRFGVKICKDEYKRLHRFDIHTTEYDGWEIIKYLNSGSSLCSFCAYQNWGEDDEHISFPWSIGKEITIDDWIIK